MKFEDNLSLTDYGTIISNGVEYDLDTLEEGIKDPNNEINDFYYDKELNLFVYTKGTTLESHIIELSDRQKKSINSSILDGNVQRLMEFAKKWKLDKLNENVDNLTSKTNTLLIEKINLYKKSLKSKASIARADISKNCFGLLKSSLVVLFFISLMGVSVGVTIVAFSLSARIGILSILSVVASFLMFTDYSESFDNKKKRSLFEIKKCCEIIKELKERLNVLDGILDGKVYYDMKNILSSDFEDGRIISDIQDYKNIYLEQLTSTRLLIEQLPLEERIAYIQELFGILEKYIGEYEKALLMDFSIIEKDMDKNILQLFQLSVLELRELNIKIHNRLKKNQSDNEMINGLNESLANAKEYTKGYTEGYGASGVAYAASPENGTKSMA